MQAMKKRPKASGSRLQAGADPGEVFELLEKAVVLRKLDLIAVRYLQAKTKR